LAPATTASTKTRRRVRKAEAAKRFIGLSRPWSSGHLLVPREPPLTVYIERDRPQSRSGASRLERRRPPRLLRLRACRQRSPRCFQKSDRKGGAGRGSARRTCDPGPSPTPKRCCDEPCQQPAVDSDPGAAHRSRPPAQFEAPTPSTVSATLARRGAEIKVG
jgi:hypothetical protein